MSLSGLLRGSGGVGLAGLLACARPLAPVPIDAGDPSAIQRTDAGLSSMAVVAPDAGPLALPNARLTADIDGGADDGGFDLLLPDASIPSTATIHFETSAALEDLRLRILTSDGRLADNRATLTVDDGGTHVALEPMRAWPARGCCRFRADGERQRLPSDATTSYLPFEASFSIERDPNAAPSVAAHARHRHRHH